MATLARLPRKVERLSIVRCSDGQTVVGGIAMLHMARYDMFRYVPPKSNEFSRYGRVLPAPLLASHHADEVDESEHRPAWLACSKGMVSYARLLALSLSFA